MANNVELSTILGREYRPVSGSFKTAALLVLKASVALRKLPLNLVLLVDCSSSMAADGKLEGTRAAALELVKGLKTEDCLSVVSFATGTRAVYGPTVGDKSAAGGALAKLEASGVTNLSAGIDAAVQCLRQAPAGEWVRLIMVLSDGMPTQSDGNFLPEAQLAQFHTRAKELAAQEQICVSTVGLGSAENYDATFLGKLAEMGNGMFYYAKEPSELAGKFAEEIAKKGSAVASDLVFKFSRLGDGKVHRFCKVFPEYLAVDPPHIVNGEGVAHCGPFQSNDAQKFYVEFVSTGGSTEEKRLLGHIDVQFSGAVQAGTDVFVKDTRDPRALESPLNSEVEKGEAAARLQKVLSDLLQSSDPKKTKILAQQGAKLTQVLGMGKATKQLQEVEASGGVMTPDVKAGLQEGGKKTRQLAS